MKLLQTNYSNFILKQFDMYKFCFLFFLLICFETGYAQYSRSSYGLSIIEEVTELQRSIAKDSNKAFVSLKDYIPEILLDIKYATKSNVFQEQFYDHSYALLRKPAAEALLRVQSELLPKGLSLKIYDAYRPYSVTCRMWSIIPDTTYMGLPWKGSKHNRGIAVDLTLIDTLSGKELAMPTAFDAFVKEAHPSYSDLPKEVKQNRDLLISTMTKHGFSVDPVEWWHFNFNSAIEYELLDLPHHQIIQILKLIKKN